MRGHQLQRIVALAFRPVLEVGRNQRQPLIYRLLTGDLDQARRRVQGIRFRVGTELREVDARALLCTHDALALQGIPVQVVGLEQVLDPLRLRPPAGVGLFEAQPLGQARQDPVVAPRRARRLEDLAVVVHVAAAAHQVRSLQVQTRRENDVRVARRRREVRVLHHNGIQTLEGPRILDRATAPVDGIGRHDVGHLHRGIQTAVQQEPSPVLLPDRAHRLMRSRRQASQSDASARMPSRVRKAAAPHPHIAAHARQRDHRPFRLLAVARPLGSQPRQQQGRLRRRVFSRQPTDRVGRHVRDPGRPFRRLWRAVVFTQYVPAIVVVAHAVGCHEVGIDFPLRCPHVGNGRDQRHIRARPDRNPLIGQHRAVGVPRVDQDDPGAPVSSPGDEIGQVDPVPVLRRVHPPQDDEPGVEQRSHVDRVVGAPKHPSIRDRRAPSTHVPVRARYAAPIREEPPRGTGTGESPAANGSRPAQVEDRLETELVPSLGETLRHLVQRLVPRDLVEFV